MKRTLIAVLMFLLLLTACAPSYSVKTSTDRITGVTSNRLSNRMQLDMSTALDLTLALADDNSRIVFGGTYLANDWLFIEGGILKADEKIIQFTAATRRTVLSGGRISETFATALTPEEFHAIAHADELLLRLNGKWNKDITISPEFRQPWQDFYTDYVL